MGWGSDWDEDVSDLTTDVGNAVSDYFSDALGTLIGGGHKGPPRGGWYDVVMKHAEDQKNMMRQREAQEKAKMAENNSDTTGTSLDGYKPYVSASAVGYPAWLYDTMQNDPGMQLLMQQLYGDAQKDYGAMFKGAARQAADSQTQRISDALSARGGGALAPSLMLGGSLRTDAELEGLKAAQGAKQGSQDALLNAMTLRFNIMNQTMGGVLGQQQAQMQYAAARKQTEAQEYGYELGLLGDLVSNF